MMINSYKFFQLVLVLFLLVGTSTPTNAQTSKKNTTKTSTTKSSKTSKSTSTKKKKAKNGESSGASNKYQDLTARYNGYFNAKILMLQSLEKLKEQHKDEFDDEILNVFTFNDSNETSAMGADMETILKKTSVAIQKHPNAKWVDDCYLLMGQAYFFKGDYQEAAKSFQFINNKFKRGIRLTDLKKKEKAEKKKEAIKFNIGGLTNEEGKTFDKEERIKQNEDKKKEAEKVKEEKEKQIEDRRKEKEVQMKAREKERKNLQKERAKIAKQKEVERKRKLKWKEANRKRKIKGQKPLPYKPKYTFDKNEDTPKEDLDKETEEIKEVIEQTPEQVEAEKEPEEITETEEQKPMEEEEAPELLLSKNQASTDDKAVKYNDRLLSFLFHEPSKYESVVWLARTYMAMGNANDAITSLEYIKQDKNMPRSQRADLNGLYAQYHLNKGENKEAYNYLDMAINESRNKKEKARLHYIQAQISEENKEYADNVASLKKVLNNRPNYNMGFNAKLDIAQNQVKAGNKSPKESLRYLEKMLKDDKNFDNRDQIYMTMADIAIDSGDIETAFDYLKKATDNSTINSEVKAKAYLKIAEMYYDQEKYLLSSAYYDSSLVTLPKTFPNYDDIVLRKDVLADLAAQINIVELQDSLLKLASLPEAVRNDIIDELIAKIEAQAQANAQGVTEMQTNDDNNSNNPNNTAGTFYFYNENARSLGKIDFMKVWGNRPNVDNWRRSAAITNNDNSQQSAQQADLNELALGGQLSRDMFLKALPFSNEAKADANSKVEAALYEIALIYQEKLDANDKAIAYFEQLLSRFPNSTNATKAHYALYQIYKLENNTAQANIHKNWLAQNDPNSEYAKLATNQTSNNSDKNAVLAFYETTYQLFEQGNYDEVLNRKKQAEIQFASNELQPEFDLLEAFVIGSTNAIDKYIAALQTVSTKHKGTEVQAKADEILQYLDVDKKKAVENASMYTFDETQQHYYLIIMDGYTQNITKAINSFADFNTKNHQSDNLKVTQMLLDKDHPIILIKSFQSKTKSDLYTKSIETQLTEILKTIEVPYYNFAISKSNFNTFFKDKNTEPYLLFYKEKY